MTAKIGYHIEIEPQRAQEMKALLDQLGVRFHPTDDIIVWEDENTELSHLRGHMVPELVERVNLHLEGQGLEPRLPGYSPEWTPERRHRFLQFAICWFNWQCLYDLEGNNFRSDPREWERIVQENPTLFLMQ